MLYINLTTPSPRLRTSQGRLAVVPRWAVMTVPLWVTKRADDTDEDLSSASRCCCCDPRDEEDLIKDDDDELPLDLSTTVSVFQFESINNGNHESLCMKTRLSNFLFNF